MDWLEKHGEQFLCKSIGVGRNMQKAYACQKSQDNFEKVVQVRLISHFYWRIINLNSFMLQIQTACQDLLPHTNTPVVITPIK